MENIYLDPWIIVSRKLKVTLQRFSICSQINIKSYYLIERLNINANYSRITLELRISFEFQTESENLYNVQTLMPCSTER